MAVECSSIFYGYTGKARAGVEFGNHRDLPAEGRLLDETQPGQAPFGSPSVMHPTRSVGVGGILSGRRMADWPQIDGRGSRDRNDSGTRRIDRVRGQHPPHRRRTRGLLPTPSSAAANLHRA
jgi:hypothetical protein